MTKAMITTIPMTARLSALQCLRPCVLPRVQIPHRSDPSKVVRKGLCAKGDNLRYVIKFPGQWEMMFDQRKAGRLHREGMHLTQVNSSPTASSGRAYRFPGQPGPKASRKRYENLAKAPQKATRRRRQPTVSTPADRRLAVRRSADDLRPRRRRLRSRTGRPGRAGGAGERGAAREHQGRAGRRDDRADSDGSFRMVPPLVQHCAFRDHARRPPSHERHTENARKPRRENAGKPRPKNTPGKHAGKTRRETPRNTPGITSSQTAGTRCLS
jgi:hypothetical protein